MLRDEVYSLEDTPRGCRGGRSVPHPPGVGFRYATSLRERRASLGGQKFYFARGVHICETRVECYEMRRIRLKVRRGGLRGGEGDTVPRPKPPLSMQSAGSGSERLVGRSMRHMRLTVRWEGAEGGGSVRPLPKASRWRWRWFVMVVGGG